MKGINKVTIMGSLGKDPDMKQTGGGSAVANMSVATNESWNDKNTGQKVEKTEWHKVVVFGKLAGICGQYLKKGSQVYFEGKIQTRKWQDQSGNDRYTTEIVANEMLMLGGRSNQDPASSGMSNASAGTNVPAKSAALPSGEGDEFDDIPF